MMNISINELCNKITSCDSYEAELDGRLIVTENQSYIINPNDDIDNPRVVVLVRQMDLLERLHAIVPPWIGTKYLYADLAYIKGTLRMISRSNCTFEIFDVKYINLIQEGINFSIDFQININYM